MACIVPAISLADYYTTGDSIETLTLNNQHDEPGLVDQGTKAVLFSRNKNSNELITESLKEQSGASLKHLRIVYVADISGMPGLISKFVAIPAMKDYSFPVLLDREGKLTSAYPTQEGKATLIFLEGLKIRKIDYLNSVEEIRQALQLQ
jgi:hypothetical protein